MGRRRIKIPSGRSTKPRPDRLRRMLKQSSAPDSTASSETHTSSGQTRYSVGNFYPGRLRGQVLTQFGAGSVGGYLLRDVSHLGLKIHVVDCKAVEDKHLIDGRTVYEYKHVGMRKVEALKRKLETEFPDTRVFAYHCDLADISDGQLHSMLEGSKIAILAVDDPSQILRVSDFAYWRLPLIQVAMHRRGESGHMAVSMPGQTPCLRCILDIDSARQIRRLDSEPADSQDIMHVAQQAARLASDLLHATVTGQAVRRWKTSNHLIHIANTRQRDSPDGPGVKYITRHKRSGCRICNNFNPF